MLANPRIGARSSVRPSVAGGDVCEERLLSRFSPERKAEKFPASAKLLLIMFVIVFRNDRCNTCAVRGLLLLCFVGVAVPQLPVIRNPRTFCFRFCAFFCRNKKQQNANKFDIPFALHYIAFGLDRLRLGNAQINLAFRSPCTTLRQLRYRLDRLRLSKMQINLLLRSPCTIFVPQTYYER